ncbi:MAG: flagellar biosynthetic protein FliQ [Pseudomonadota bacterium]
MGSDIFSIVGEAINIFLLMCLPPLVAALIMGLIVSIIQTVTQIQDAGLPTLVKLVTIIAVMLFSLPPIFSGLTAFTQKLFQLIAVI